jgi:tRNA nucleotidyltransferase (CCA-adding enzyme)
MDVYLVGGAVRDALLGLPIKDRDWVVVGATPRQMLDRGFTPVGSDFPVFLHPVSHEQYALARTERKTAPGYRGFVVHAAPDVTLEQDLARRDLTVNAMAIAAADVRPDGGFDPQHAHLIDPWKGLADLRGGVLRHVTDAFREDPVRILRVARFAARFPTFSVHPTTLALMQAMVAAGEADALVAERVWQELANGLMAADPGRMAQLLQASGAWAHVLPELGSSASDPIRWSRLQRALGVASQAGAALAVRYAAMAQAVDEGSPPARQAAIARLGERLRAPADMQDLALLLERERDALAQSPAFDPEGLVALLERCDAWRRPDRAQALWLAASCVSTGRSAANADWAPHARLKLALAAALAVDAQAVVRQALANGLTGPDIGNAVRSARVAAVGAALSA